MNNTVFPMMLTGLRFDAIRRRLDHGRVEHAVAEVGENRRRGFSSRISSRHFWNDEQEETGPGGDRAEHPPGAAASAPLDEGRVQVVLRARVLLLDQSFAGLLASPNGGFISTTSNRLWQMSTKAKPRTASSVKSRRWRRWPFWACSA